MVGTRGVCSISTCYVEDKQTPLVDCLKPITSKLPSSTYHDKRQPLNEDTDVKSAEWALLIGFSRLWRTKIWRGRRNQLRFDESDSGSMPMRLDAVVEQSR